MSAPSEPRLTRPRPARARPPLWITLVIEWGPAAVFVLTYRVSDLFTAKAALMAATAAAFLAAWRLERRIAVLPLLSLVLILGFGSLALWLRSETAIKVIPTVIDLLFSGLLLVAYQRGLPWLRLCIGPQMPAITAPAWHRLTLRYCLFFLTTAVLNEAIWRSQPTELWVLFKSYGAPLLLLFFIASQVPFVRRHRVAV